MVPSEAGRAEKRDGAARSTVIGTSSEPIKRTKVSLPLTKGTSRGLANPRSITEYHALPGRGNLV